MLPIDFMWDSLTPELRSLAMEEEDELKIPRVFPYKPFKELNSYQQHLVSEAASNVEIAFELQVASN